MAPMGDSGLLIIVTMKEDVAEMQEITISYVNPDWPGELRRQTLKRDYGFDCSCKKCKDEIDLVQRDLEQATEVKAPEGHGGMNQSESGVVWFGSEKAGKAGRSGESHATEHDNVFPEMNVILNASPLGDFMSESLKLLFRRWWAGFHWSPLSGIDWF